MTTRVVKLQSGREGRLRRLQKNDRVTQTGIQSMEREAVKNLMSYVPVCLIDHILEREKQWDRNERLENESFWAAGIFIDISGFSSLASDLNRAEQGEKKGRSALGEGFMV